MTRHWNEGVVERSQEGGLPPRLLESPLSYRESWGNAFRSCSRTLPQACSDVRSSRSSPDYSRHSDTESSHPLETSSPGWASPSESSTLSKDSQEKIEELLQQVLYPSQPFLTHSSLTSRKKVMGGTASPHFFDAWITEPQRCLVMASRSKDLGLGRRPHPQT